MKKKLFALILCLTVFCSAMAIPATTSAAAEAWNTVNSVEAGGTYLFSCAGMKDYKDVTHTNCVVKSVQSADPHGLAYCEKPSSDDFADDLLWELESAKEGGKFYLKSKATGKYLNMKPGGSNGKGFASMETAPQALSVTFTSGLAKISAVLDGTTYYIRFTNSYGREGSVSCWEAATADGSNQFSVYANRTLNLAEYKNTTDPLFSIACFSDLHVDYGIQSYASPVRPGTVKAANYVKSTLGAVDVALVGGDITSNNGGKPWNTTLINKTQDTIYSTIANATKDGKVMFVSGNHENEAGVIAKDGYVSGDYSKYMTDNIGKYKATLYFNEMGVGTSQYNELLCYRYEVKNVEFIGINTPYRTSRSGGYTYLEQIKWVEAQLADIGKDETVVIFCHYPISSIANAPGQTGAQAAMKTMLNKYPNVLYCYGHVHGGSEYYAWYSSSELVVPSGSATKLSNNAYQTDSYINVHMGSMGYYKTQFAPNSWLGEEEPLINQLLTIDFYEDHITFKYHNTGKETAVEGVTDIASYTVMRDLGAQLSGNSGGSTSTSTSTSSSTSSSTSTSTTTDGGTTTDTVDGTSSATPSNPSTNPDTNTDTNTGSVSITDSQTGTASSEDPSETDGLSSETSTDSAGGSSDSSANPPSEALPVAAIVLLVAGGVTLLGGGGIALWYLFVFSKKK